MCVNYVKRIPNSRLTFKGSPEAFMDVVSIHAQWSVLSMHICFSIIHMNDNIIHCKKWEIENSERHKHKLNILYTVNDDNQYKWLHEEWENKSTRNDTLHLT